MANKTKFYLKLFIATNPEMKALKKSDNRLFKSRYCAWKSELNKAKRERK